jgi:hypothetical protein
MEETSWSNGTKYEKSNKKKVINSNDLDKSNLSSEKKNMETMINQNFILKETKRDGFNEKIGMRQMTGQTNLNPFRADNNYISDLEDQDKYLRPKKLE